MSRLVAYYSRTGNTKFVAEEIAKQLGADLCEIRDKKKREGKLNYLGCGKDAMQENLTEIEISKPIEKYDFVVVGSPVWAGKITPAIRKFLVSNDFSNKQVAVFITLDDKPEMTFKNLKETIKLKSLVGELAIFKALKKREENKQKIADWCRQIQQSLA